MTSGYYYNSAWGPTEAVNPRAVLRGLSTRYLSAVFFGGRAPLDV